MNLEGWQHEYWLEANTDLLPAVRVRGDDGLPVKVTVPVWDGELRPTSGVSTSDARPCTCSTPNSPRTDRSSVG